MNDVAHNVLHVAAALGNDVMVLFLLGNGANVTLETEGAYAGCHGSAKGTGAKPYSGQLGPRIDTIGDGCR